MIGSATFAWSQRSLVDTVVASCRVDLPPAAVPCLRLHPSSTYCDDDALGSTTQQNEQNVLCCAAAKLSGASKRSTSPAARRMRTPGIWEQTGNCWGNWFGTLPVDATNVCTWHKMTYSDTSFTLLLLKSATVNMRRRALHVLPMKACSARIHRNQQLNKTHLSRIRTKSILAVPLGCMVCV